MTCLVQKKKTCLVHLYQWKACSRAEEFCFHSFSSSSLGLHVDKCQPVQRGAVRCTVRSTVRCRVWWTVRCTVRCTVWCTMWATWCLLMQYCSCSRELSREWSTGSAQHDVENVLIFLCSAFRGSTSIHQISALSAAMPPDGHTTGHRVKILTGFLVYRHFQSFKLPLSCTLLNIWLRNVLNG